MDLLSAMNLFVRVVELESFTRAAAEQGVSSSAVSKQVAMLEQHFKARLLHRTTRSLSVTDIGDAVYHQCKRVLSEVSEAENLVAGLQGEPRGQLRISCNMTFGQQVLAKALPDFMARYPDVQLDVTLDDRMPDMVREGYDLMIRIKGQQLADSSLVARKLCDLPMFICAAPGYLAANGWPASPEELKQHNCLVFVHAENAHQWLVAEPGTSADPVEVDGDLKANNSVVVREAVLAGRGIANLASFLIADHVACGDIVPVFPRAAPDRLSAYAFYPTRDAATLKVARFIEFFESWLAEHIPQRLPEAGVEA
ncbi:LysR family transcriptional regulator [Marinobacterium nitratireducens]|uniref:LysR family transcriptional regulator n=1 Tax=Marinobacterium nitratireducens TaxID=518897 RepID=A0A917ZC92_9GAMM|nr:LysR family transcriptional regulator [Marinobacterium nitratireducens]GGO79132.1 LysR family transcriptional regulator [Marinobacterium nitratireducens]